MKTPLVLFILDGWGHREQSEYNPCKNANTPFIDSLFSNYPHRLINAHGEHVGLPENQMGNSEVGHLHLGAGRLVRQDLSRITHATQTGELEHNALIQSCIAHQKAHPDSKIHILGLLSPGGVHSHENHIQALVQLFAKAQTSCLVHAFLDGRDVPPRSAAFSLNTMSALFEKTQNGRIASISGRYFAMDRDQRWDRVEKCYQLLAENKAAFHAPSALDALEMAYARDENDEFVTPTLIDGDNSRIQDDDIVIFMNFRADRARELSHALTDELFDHFERPKRIALNKFITLTQYDSTLEADVLFAPTLLQNTLGAVLAKHHLHQLRIAETEKYAHVTYFFNGGIEEPNPNETRILVKSPSVATYDLQPEMSAIELTDKLVEAINSNQYDVVICNYANPDMVGHTGYETAANSAMETMDQCLQRAINAIENNNGQALITADHGNIECMFDENTGQAHTAHTTNQVPLIYIGEDKHFDDKPAALYDVAPTMLQLLHIAPPKVMTGRGLLH